MARHNDHWQLLLALIRPGSEYHYSKPFKPWHQVLICREVARAAVQLQQQQQQLQELLAALWQQLLRSWQLMKGN
jgi:hypothetical protein